MTDEKLIFKSTSRDFPEDGFTNCKISNSSYVKILALKSATNKPAQDIFNELIDYALENSMVEKYDGTRVKVSDIINLVV
ncbi:MAG: hypothetical protein J5999_09295 [Oscillospiraceae bacterium]|nr:hypothetical protein [Oscillospiraceae bacterium]